MAFRIPAALRRRVSKRAEFRCEYCLMPDGLTLHRHEPDHILPRQHGGKTTFANLALACLRCNRHKGPNVGSFDPETGELVALFNPREQSWEEHFALDEEWIRPLSPEARVTSKILQLNHEDRLEERRILLGITRKTGSP
jgi:hypothetical protein